MDITVQIISNKQELNSIAEAWDLLYQRSENPSFFSSFKYVCMWYEHFATPTSIRIYLARIDQKIVGILPLVLNQRNDGIRELSNLTNDHCLLAPPLIPEVHSEQVQKALLQALDATRHDWDLFKNSYSYSFQNLPGLFTDHQLNNSRQRWHKLVELSYSINRKISFKEYFEKTLSRKFKKNLNNLNNRLQKEQKPSYFVLKGQDAIAFWPKFLELEASGWKGKSNTAISCTSVPMQKYYTQLVRQLAETNQVYLCGLNIDNTLIAAEFGYLDQGIFHMAKGAYNEEYAHLGPSNLLLLYLFENLPEQVSELKHFHLFPWDTGYKSRLTNEDSLCISTVIYSKSLKGKILYLSSQIKKTVKNKAPGIAVFLKKHINKTHSSNK